MPTWVLALSFWLHMVATIIWVGGLALMALIVWPGARTALGAGQPLADLMRELNRRFEPLTWLCLAVLIATGLTQMSANPHYEGFLKIENGWAMALLLKHLAIGGMIAIGVYLRWVLQPALARLALLEARGQATPEVETWRGREITLTRLNLVCGLLVLALTAVARVF